MSEITPTPTAPTAVEAIEGSLFELYRNYGRSPLARLEDRPEMLRLTTGLPLPEFNAVAHAWLPEDEVDERIEAALAWFGPGRIPVMWWTGPSTRPADLGRHLQRHGFVLGQDMPGMAADLPSLRAGPAGPPGLTIEYVRDVDGLAQWTAVVGHGFDMPDRLVEPLLALERSLGFEDERWRRYLGLLEGEAVAASALLLGAGAAGIYNVATRPGFRRRGLGTALTLEALRDGRRLGYHTAVLHSSPQAVGIYWRLGFREYCRVSQYLRPAPGSLSER